MVFAMVLEAIDIRPLGNARCNTTVQWLTSVDISFFGCLGV
jgi:hypothetical protein